MRDVMLWLSNRWQSLHSLQRDTGLTLELGLSVDSFPHCHSQTPHEVVNHWLVKPHFRSSIKITIKEIRRLIIISQPQLSPFQGLAAYPYSYAIFRLLRHRLAVIWTCLAGCARPVVRSGQNLTNTLPTVCLTVFW